ncbi:MAG: RNA polymerase sigma factor [Armatimonadota bacterium]
MRGLQHWRERRLLQRIRSGDREAAGRLVDAHYEAVYRWLLHLCRDRERAADLTQETFVQVWEDLDGFRGDATAKTWIHRIAYHTFLRAQRRSRPDTVPLDESVSDGTPTETALTRHALRSALAQLPEKQGQVLILHYLQGFKVAEIADVLEVPAGTVLSRLHNGRNGLRELLCQEPSPATAEVQTNAEDITAEQ